MLYNCEGDKFSVAGLYVYRELICYVVYERCGRMGEMLCNCWVFLPTCIVVLCWLTSTVDRACSLRRHTLLVRMICPLHIYYQYPVSQVAVLLTIAWALHLLGVYNGQGKGCHKPENSVNFFY